MPDHAEAIARAADAMNAGDLEGYLDLYDERLTFHGLGPEPLGKDAVRALLAGLGALPAGA